MLSPEVPQLTRKHILDPPDLLTGGSFCFAFKIDKSSEYEWMPEEPERQETHSSADRQRRKATLAASAVALVLLALLIWLVRDLVEQQRIERCLANRRPDCFRIDTPMPERPVEIKR